MTSFNIGYREKFSSVYYILTDSLNFLQIEKSYTSNPIYEYFQVYISLYKKNVFSKTITKKCNLLEFSALYILFR